MQSNLSTIPALHDTPDLSWYVQEMSQPTPETTVNRAGGITTVVMGPDSMIIAVPILRPARSGEDDTLPSPQIWRRIGLEAPEADEGALLAMSAGAGKALDILSPEAKGAIRTWRTSVASAFAEGAVSLDHVASEVVRTASLPAALLVNGVVHAPAVRLEFQSPLPVLEGVGEREVVWVVWDDTCAAYVAVDTAVSTEIQGMPLHVAVYADGSIRMLDSTPSARRAPLRVRDIVTPKSATLEAAPRHYTQAPAGDEDEGFEPGVGASASMGEMPTAADLGHVTFAADGFDEEDLPVSAQQTTHATAPVPQGSPVVQGAPPSVGEPVLTPLQVAEMLQMDMITVEGLIRDDVIESQPQGDGTRMIRWSAVMRWRRVMATVTQQGPTNAGHGAVAQAAPAAPPQRTKTLAAAGPVVSVEVEAPSPSPQTSITETNANDAGHGGEEYPEPTFEEFGGFDGEFGPSPDAEEHSMSGGPSAYDGPPPDFDMPPMGDFGDMNQGGSHGGGGGKGRTKGKKSGGWDDAPSKRPAPSVRPAPKSQPDDDILSGRSASEGVVNLTTWSDIRPRGSLWMAELLICVADWDELERWSLATEVRLLHMSFPLTRSAKQQIEQVLQTKVRERALAVRVYMIDGKDHFVRPLPDGGYRVVGPRGKIVVGKVKQQIIDAFARETSAPRLVSSPSLVPTDASADAGAPLAPTKRRSLS